MPSNFIHNYDMKLIIKKSIGQSLLTENIQVDTQKPVKNYFNLIFAVSVFKQTNKKCFLFIYLVVSVS